VALTSLDGLDALRTVHRVQLKARTFLVRGEAPPSEHAGLVALVDVHALDGVAVGDVVIEGSRTALSALTALPAWVQSDGANVALRNTALTTLDGPVWPATLGTLTLFGNTQLTSLSALGSVSAAGQASVTQNRLVAQCAVDERLAAWSLPPDLGDPGNAGTTGNNSSCTCDGAVVTSCLPCQASFEPLTSTTQCVLGRVIIESSETPLDLPALVYAEGLVLGRTGDTTSLPALVRARTLEFASFVPSLPGSAHISLPALQSANLIDVGANALLVSVDLSSLQRAQTISFQCPGPPGEAVQTPLAALDLSSAQQIDTLDVRGCSALPLCALEHDLAHATVTALHDDGLNALCTCDAQGDVTAGSCTR
jgi:hypothetical protein